MWWTFVKSSDGSREYNDIEQECELGEKVMNMSKICMIFKADVQPNILIALYINLIKAFINCLYF